MKTGITILFIALTIYSKASTHFETLRDTLKICSNISELKEKLNGNFNDFTVTRKSERHTRKLDFGCTHTYFEIEVVFEASFLEKFHLYTVSDSNSNLIFGIIQQIGYYGDIKDSSIFLEDKGRIDKYINEHNSLYSVSLTRDDFDNQLSELLVYGYGCGESGLYNPPKAEEKAKIIKEQHYSDLSAWLRQFSPEIQSYAIDGLMYLERKGIPLDELDKEIIEHLKRRNSVIYTCSGCLFGMSTTTEEIIDENLKK